MLLTTEIHPDWYHDVPVMHSLILGSFPPHPNKRYFQFYYPNLQNRFWKILSSLAGLPLNVYPKNDPRLLTERYAIMENLETGVQNMGREITRQGTSARDTHIVIKQYHDIISIIRTHPELKGILLPGYSAADSTLNSFLKYLRSNNIEAPCITNPKGGVTIFTVEIEQREFTCHVLNSTSTASSVPYDVVLNQFKKAFELV